MSVTFNEARDASNDVSGVRKTLGAIVLIADEDAPVVETLTDASGNLTIPAGYHGLGYLDESGITFERNIETESVRALGYISDIRRDITSAERTVTLTALEWDKPSIRELADAVDLSNVEVGDNGEVSYDIADVPSIKYYRMLVIARDGALDSEILRARLFARVSVTSYPSETWSNTDTVSGELGLTAYHDEEAGFTVREFLGGRGFDAAKYGYGVTTP